MLSETQFIEWKSSWEDDHLKQVCGFANAQGGTLEVGRNDKGQLIGLPNAHKLQVDLPNKILQHLGIVAAVEHQQIDGHDLVRIIVQAYTHPISLRGRFYYRSGATNQELKGTALQHFLLKKSGQTWDSIIEERADVDDLDLKALVQFRNQAIQKNRLDPNARNDNDVELIAKLHLGFKGQLKRAAVLLFHPQPENFVAGACIKIGYFGKGDEVLYQDLVQGHLFDQAEKTIELLNSKYFKALISYQGLQRIERLPLPEPVLREAILNAIVHKDYSSGVPIQISVYADKIMIWNKSQEHWTIDQLMSKHASHPFNPDIARVFFLSGLIEGWGQGIDKMRKGCLLYDVPEPKFHFNQQGLWVEFKNHEALLNPKNDPRNPSDTVNEPENEPEKPSDTVNEPENEPENPSDTVSEPENEPENPSDTVSEPENDPRSDPQNPSGTTNEPRNEEKDVQELVLNVLEAEPRMTIKQVATRTNKSTSTLKRVIKQLQNEKRLQRIGPDKGGHWKVNQQS